MSIILFSTCSSSSVPSFVFLYFPVELGNGQTQKGLREVRKKDGASNKIASDFKAKPWEGSYRWWKWMSSTINEEKASITAFNLNRYRTENRPEQIYSSKQLSQKGRGFKWQTRGKQVCCGCCCCCWVAWCFVFPRRLEDRMEHCQLHKDVWKIRGSIVNYTNYTQLMFFVRWFRHSG